MLGAFVVPLMTSWRPSDSLSPQALGDRSTGGTHAGHAGVAPGAGHPLLSGRRADAALTKPHAAPPRPRLSQSRSCSLLPITCPQFSNIKPSFGNHFLIKLSSTSFFLIRLSSSKKWPQPHGRSV